MSVYHTVTLIMKPEFSTYTEAQLRDVLRRIDKRKFPERVEEIEHLLADPVFLHNTRRDKAIRDAEELEQNDHNQKVSGIAWIIGYGVLLVIFGVSTNRYAISIKNDVNDPFFRYGFGLLCIFGGSYWMYKYYKNRNKVKRK